MELWHYFPPYDINNDLTVRDTTCTGDISGECTNYDTDVICKVKQSHVQVSIGCVEAAEAPVQPVADFVTAVWALQHRPLCLGQELRNQGQIAQAWKSKYTHKHTESHT